MLERTRGKRILDDQAQVLLFDAQRFHALGDTHVDQQFAHAPDGVVGCRLHVHCSYVNAQQLSDVSVLFLRVGHIVGHRVGQQQPTDQPMWDVIPRAQGVGHAVYAAEPGIGHGAAGQHAAIEHVGSGLQVASVLNGFAQRAGDARDGLDGQAVCHG